MSEPRYPLYWPPNVPLTKYRKRAAFRGADGRGQKTMEQATRALEAEISKINAGGVVLSTNMELRLDGGLRSSRGSYVSNPGAALYFTRKGQRICMPCDKWDRTEDNVYAIAMHMEAIRAMERWGVGTTEQAYAGYKALAATNDWWEVLKVDRSHSTKDEIDSAYRREIWSAHPDRGGSNEAMSRLNVARDEALREKL